MDHMGGYTTDGSVFGAAFQTPQTPTIDTPLGSSSPSCFSEMETERGTPISTPSQSPALSWHRAGLSSSSHFETDRVRPSSTLPPFRAPFPPPAPSSIWSVAETERGTRTFTPSRTFPSRSPLGPRDLNSPSSPPATPHRTRDNREGVPFIGTPAVGRGGDWSKVAHAKIALREALQEPLQPEVCLCIYAKGRDGVMEITIAHRDFMKLSEEIEVESGFKRVEPSVGQGQRELSNDERTARKQVGRWIAEKLLDDWATYGADGFGEICILVGGEECRSFVMKKGAEFSRSA